MKRSNIQSQHLFKILSNPKYKGRHLVIIRNKVFSAKTGQEASRIFKRIIKKYPAEKPTITYVPKEDMLILIELEKL